MNHTFELKSEMKRFRITWTEKDEKGTRYMECFMSAENKEALRFVLKEGCKVQEVKE